MDAQNSSPSSREGRNGVIGVGDGLPWKLSSDLKRFKARTMGKPMIMGRKTWEAIGRPLPGRETIVLTRDSHFTPPKKRMWRHNPTKALAQRDDSPRLLGATRSSWAAARRFIAAFWTSPT